MGVSLRASPPPLIDICFWGLVRRPLRLSLTIVFGVSSGVPSASFVFFPEGLAFDPTPHNPHTNENELE